METATKPQVTLTNLTDALTAKGLKWETHRDEWGELTEIGINTQDWIWTWWNIYKMGNGETWISFSHVYSQTTGSTIKTWSRGYKLGLMIERLTGVNPSNVNKL